MRLLLPLAMATLLLAAPIAAAHQTWYDNGKTQTAASKVRFVYGNLYEPVSTFQKTGLDLGVFDITGKPVTGLECVDGRGERVPNAPFTTLALTYAGQTLDLSAGCKAQHGKPGWYTFPVIYTRPGSYVLQVKGTVNGTAVDLAIQPAHPVADSSGEMFPVKVEGAEASAAKVAELSGRVAELDGKVAQLTGDLDALRSRLASLENKGSKGAGTGGVALLGLVAVLGLAAVRRGA
ncbi:MAG TPA: hypothetical protein VHI93_00990 [Candidatus Thermoplasmatota archaeon]|nr:hypothetical protein [Candidatus Thermoplasmatota archaeon]